MAPTKKILFNQDGCLVYYKDFISKDESTIASNALIDEAAWNSDVLKLFGKTIVTRRKVAFQGDDGIHYTYSGFRKTQVPGHLK